MRILLTAAIAASLAAGSLSALAQTAAPTPAKQKACKTLKGENACTNDARIALGPSQATRRANAKRLRSRRRRSSFTMAAAQAAIMQPHKPQEKPQGVETLVMNGVAGVLPPNA